MPLSSGTWGRSCVCVCVLAVGVTEVYQHPCLSRVWTNRPWVQLKTKPFKDKNLQISWVSLFQSIRVLLQWCFFNSLKVGWISHWLWAPPALQLFPTQTWGGERRKEWPQAGSVSSHSCLEGTELLLPSNMAYRLPGNVNACNQWSLIVVIPFLWRNWCWCWWLRYIYWWCLLPLLEVLIHSVNISAPPVWPWYCQPVQCLPCSIHHRLWLVGYHWADKPKLHLIINFYVHSTAKVKALAIGMSKLLIHYPLT